ncbi:conserved hypothetical protein [Paraburkholderia ribeironis]|uniref:Uncharacterized protein n=1 Tax=Paraburkholderia ribeironis TaxID=1247936 RepID=A0A1N7RUC9_9BURK|nr:hypothetical protein [Paraburkholderia ribeironis]SIT38694.1 conserved hypothetical protein [Paraburkholderia ribeironis]
MIPTGEWVIQIVMRPRAFEHNRRWRYLPWASYTHPMTGDQAMCALRECEAHWPAYGFRAHLIGDDKTRIDLPGQSADCTHPVGL